MAYPITTTDSAYYGGTDLGNYQFTSLDEVITQFIIAYVGEDKIISKIKRTDVAFHASRALQELSFDTFKSVKAFELLVPSTLILPLPKDYVNYVKIVSVDSAGIEHIIYPAIKTSNPQAPNQNADGTFDFDHNNDGDTDESGEDTLQFAENSTTWNNFSTNTPSELQQNDFDYDDEIFDDNQGQRYGIDPQHAQVNGSYYIDELKGNLHFSSNLNGKKIILKYISDSLGSTSEMKVHKFAEEAMYKYIAHAILATRANTPEYLVQRFKREAFAAKRQAKHRLSNIKIEEITQILTGKSKHIRH